MRSVDLSHSLFPLQESSALCVSVYISNIIPQLHDWINYPKISTEITFNRYQFTMRRSQQKFGLSECKFESEELCWAQKFAVHDESDQEFTNCDELGSTVYRAFPKIKRCGSYKTIINNRLSPLKYFNCEIMYLFQFHSSKPQNTHLIWVF